MPVLSDRNQIANLKESQKDCYICNEAGGRSERSVIVTCDICSFWVCKDCAQIEPKLYEFLVKNKTDLNFICPKCKDQLPKIKDLVKISQRQTEIEIEINKMKMIIDENKTSIAEFKNMNVAGRLNQIEQIIQSNKLDDEDYPPLPAMKTAAQKMQAEISTQQIATTKLSTDLQEEKLKEMKKLNLIIYGIPETNEDPVYDIDEILMHAETRTEEPTDDGDGPMSGFKVASLAVDEDDAFESAKIDGEVRYGKTLLSKKQNEQVGYS